MMVKRELDSGELCAIGLEHLAELTRRLLVAQENSEEYATVRASLVAMLDGMGPPGMTAEQRTILLLKKYIMVPERIAYMDGAPDGGESP